MYFVDVYLMVDSFASVVIQSRVLGRVSTCLLMLGMLPTRSMSAFNSGVSSRTECPKMSTIHDMNP